MKLLDAEVTHIMVDQFSKQVGCVYTWNTGDIQPVYFNTHAKFTPLDSRSIAILAESTGLNVQSLAHPSPQESNAA